MLDLAVRGGTVVDGTGRARRRADVGVVEGRVVEIGTLSDAARHTIDADERVVAPGFVDVHTHYDAQLFWDPMCSPSPLHGVTTVIAGNCGISLAPVGGHDQEFLIRLLSRVEAIPYESLSEGVSFGWRTVPEFLDVVDSLPLGPNVGFLVGHSTLRRFVMGEAASDSAATPDQLRTMLHELDGSLAAGALGFSSSESATQFDGDGRPTPPNLATDEEFVSLARMCSLHRGTSLEYVPESAGYGFGDDDHDLLLMSAMAKAARRQLNWNSVLLKFPGKPDIQDRQLASADFGRDRGAIVVPMMIPHNFRVRTDLLESDVGFRTQPGFSELFDLPPTERVERLRRPEVRCELIAALEASTAWPSASFREGLGEYVVSDAVSAELQAYVGHPISEIAAAQGKSPIEAMIDLAVAANLEVGFTRKTARFDTADQRDLRRRVLRDPRLVLGASDGGAHVRGVVNVEYSTASFAELVRNDDIFTVEELVHKFTDVPARLYGLIDRGRLRCGAWADVVVFDPHTIDTSAVALRRDLPGGAPRLYSRGVGVDTVLVAGEPVVRGGELTDARPGRLLRSGRDTRTPRRPSLLRRRRTPVRTA